MQVEIFAKYDSYVDVNVVIYEILEVKDTGLHVASYNAIVHD